MNQNFLFSNLTEKQRNMKDALIMFCVKNSSERFTVPSSYLGDGFVKFSDIPSIGHIDNLYLKLTHPKNYGEI